MPNGKTYGKYTVVGHHYNCRNRFHVVDHSEQYRYTGKTEEIREKRRLVSGGRSLRQSHRHTENENVAHRADERNLLQLAKGARQEEIILKEVGEAVEKRLGRWTRG
ncbi:hypothetical protein EJ08DRAFT_662601 [Tothia fuscella]|uniref:Uncharacterized protein n=1 Tax=Tothia fuscella TaxID=1048955 RepID=A0A9P4NNG0_9PEZI|nr:hypothetical protein EJ08DRAFT_662601 [Tothia fuscella]